MEELTQYSPTAEIQYRLNYLYQALDEFAMENNGEVSEEIDTEIVKLESFLGNRLEYWVDNIAALQDGIVGMEQRIDNLKKKIEQYERTIEKQISKIESLNGHNAVTTPNHSFKWTKSKKTVVDPALKADVEAGNVPEYLQPFVVKEEKVVCKLPLASLKKAIDAGEEIDGVSIVETFTAKVE